MTSAGTAVIEQIEVAGDGLNRCDRDPVVVRFRFEPDAADGGAARARVDTRQGMLMIYDGKAPPRACITSAGIAVGSRLRVQRQSIVRGTCSPTVFRFDEALESACGSQCFDRP